MPLVVANLNLNGISYIIRYKKVYTTYKVNETKISMGIEISFSSEKPSEKFQIFHKHSSLLYKTTDRIWRTKTNV